MHFLSGEKKFYRKSSSDDAGSDHQGESRPLIRHISVEEEGEEEESSLRILQTIQNDHQTQQRSYLLLVLALMLLVSGLYFFVRLFFPQSPSQQVNKDIPNSSIVPIEEATEFLLDVGDGKQIWFRTWGSRPQEDGIPALLFVHGGPGQAVADYHDGNKRFFDPSRFFVVEVDQRGTGNSQPSVRDDYRNMRLYQDISIDLIAWDYEAVREHLGIEQWVVWGGSYGSTIGLNYCMIYPESCTAMLLRGIYLDTPQELKEVYTQRAFEDDERKRAQFQILYQVAQKDVEKAGESPPLDPNDDRRLLEIYERMITRGDKHAIWTWHTFENNLMEDDPEKQLDPQTIVDSKFEEATSVAFFETRLWLHGTFEKPSNLLRRVDQLAGIPVWICQGWHDNVCPVQNAQHLLDALEEIDHAPLLQAYFLDANHEDTDPVMANCLKNITKEFLDFYTSKN
jgi:proline iminopeptidase